MASSDRGDSSSKEFQSLGAISLKRVKKDPKGSFAEMIPVTDRAAVHGSGAPIGDQIGGESVFEGTLSHDAPVLDLTELKVDDKTVLIGAPPIGETVLPPEVMRANFGNGRGFVGLLKYGLKAPRAAQQQRELLGYIGAEVAKLKKKEQELLSALGRAARLHDLTPDECRHLVAASQEEEMSSLEQRLRADEVKQAQESADEAYEASRAIEESKLAGLERQHQALQSQYEQATRQLAEAEKRVAQLRHREADLKNRPQQNMSTDEISLQIREYESIKAQRKVAEMELEALQGKLSAAKRPITKIRQEISKVRQQALSAENTLSMVRRQAQAAVVTGRRHEAYVNRNVAEIDEEIGRTIINGSGRLPQLRQLIVSTEVSLRRVAHWESVLADQQAELDQYDEKRARLGFWLLIAILLGSLSLLLGGGELLRRMFLNIEG